MVELALAGFVALWLALGVRRPFLWVLAYLYVDIVAPQKISSILAHAPLSLIVFVLAVVGFLFLDNKEKMRVSLRQGLMMALLAYCAMTTMTADFPDAAAAKWGWVWKSLVFAIFLPFTLRTRLRIEAAATVMVLAASTIVIDGALKTLGGGGGYGELKLLVNDNTGLYEGSTLACVAIAIVPLAFWLAGNGTVLPRGRWAQLFALGLTGAGLLIPIGTEARTGLLCAGLLAVLLLRTVKRRGLYIGALVAAGMLAMPFLPSSFTDRMHTIENNKADQSASTRIAVWKWTLGYAADHPLGGGFDSFRGNRLVITTTDSQSSGGTTTMQSAQTVDQGRAFHSAYFEMLGEQGWPGLALWLTLQISGIVQLEGVQRRLRRSPDPQDKRDAGLALALQQGHFVYLLGATFVGIAYQPFIYMLIGLQIALVQQVARRRQGEDARTPARPGMTAPRTGAA